MSAEDLKFFYQPDTASARYVAQTQGIGWRVVMSYIDNFYGPRAAGRDKSRRFCVQFIRPGERAAWRRYRRAEEAWTAYEWFLRNVRASDPDGVDARVEAMLKAEEDRAKAEASKARVLVQEWRRAGKRVRLELCEDGIWHVVCRKRYDSGMVDFHDFDLAEKSDALDVYQNLTKEDGQ